MTRNLTASLRRTALNATSPESTAFTFAYVEDVPDMWGPQMFGALPILGTQIYTISGYVAVNAVPTSRALDVVVPRPDLTASIPSRSLNVILPES